MNAIATQHPQSNMSRKFLIALAAQATLAMGSSVMIAVLILAAHYAIQWTMPMITESHRSLILISIAVLFSPMCVLKLLGWFRSSSKGSPNVPPQDR